MLLVTVLVSLCKPFRDFYLHLCTKVSGCSSKGFAVEIFEAFILMLVLSQTSEGN